MAESPRLIRRLINPVRNYPWGSHSAIAELLGQPTPSPEPQAELWLGTHPQGSSRLADDDQGRSLRQWVQEQPEALLGRLDGDDALPYLLKVLAAEMPLSVQAHPDGAQAVDGYRREEAAGVDALAPQRNYRDANAKPEIILALTPFALIRGFREPADIHRRLRCVGLDSASPLLTALSDGSPSEALRTFFEALMAQDDAQAAAVQDVTLRHLDGLLELGEGAAEEARWIRRLARHYPGDRGILAPLWLHYVELEPGEAIFTPPRVLHAYLQGVGIELMGSSDNVLRGGLTPKHVDVAELMGVVEFVPRAPQVLRGQAFGAVEEVFPAPTDVFRLSRLQLRDGSAFEGSVHGPELLLCVDGSGELTGPGIRHAWRRGDAFFVAATAERFSMTGEGLVFRARQGGAEGAPERR